MSYFKFFNQSGFSVVEIILTAALFLIFSGASIIVILQGFDTNRTATVTWNVTSSRHDTVAQTTYITNWRGVNAT